MNRELLESQFDSSQVKTKKGNFGNEVSYIEAGAIIQKLNDAFDGAWSFEVLEHKILEDEVVVLGKLTAEGISKVQFGNSKITRNSKTGEVISLGDDLKAAATDSLKKCATLLGIGLYLYGGNGNGKHDPKPGRSTSRKAVRESDADSGGNGSGNGRLTNKQLQTIYSMGKSKNMSQQDIKDHCLDAFNKVPDFLTKEEASVVIQDFQVM